jgi:hypothetical protein
MPALGFESTIPVFERVKTVDALDRVDTVIGQRATRYAKKENSDNEPRKSN